MAKSKKDSLNKFLLIVIAIIVGAVLLNGGLNRMAVVPVQRDVSISQLVWSYSSLPADLKATNFSIFYYDAAAAQQAPGAIALYYEFFTATKDYYPEFNTMPEEWFVHGAGLDPTNPDNRLRTVGYNEYELDLSNVSLRQFEINKIVAKLGNATYADGLLIDLAYPSFKSGGMFTTVRNEPAVSVDGITVSVNKTPFAQASVGSYKNNITVSLNPDGSGQNKYGGSYSGYSITLISSNNKSIIYNTGLESTTTTTNNVTYPMGIYPSYFGTQTNYQNNTFSNVLVRVTDAHSGTYAWKLTVNSSDVAWSRRLATSTYTVGTGMAVTGSGWVKPLDGISQICSVMEKRRLGIAYGGPSTCINVTTYGEWMYLSTTYTLPLNTSTCGGAACDQVMFYINANQMNAPTGSMVLDDINIVQYNSLVAPGTQLYVTYGASATAPSIEGVTNFHTYMKSTLQALKAQMPAGKLLMFNQIEGSNNADYLDVTDGAQDEGFIRAYWESPNDEAHLGKTGDAWKQEMDISQSVIRSGKYLTLDCGVYSGATPTYRQRVFNYCFTSFLLLQKKGQVGFTFEALGNNTGWYFPEYDYKYGTPMGDYYLYNSGLNIYARNYTSSFVLVNPTMINVDVTLPEEMLTKDGAMVTTVSLNNRTGLVLYRQTQVIVNNTNTTTTNTTTTNTTITNTTITNNTVTNNTQTNNTNGGDITPPNPGVLDIIKDFLGNTSPLLVGAVVLVGGYILYTQVIAKKGKRRR